MRIVCGPSFGEHEEKMAVTLKALHGLKSSAANFHHLLADALRGMGFLPSKCDENVQMRKEADGSNSCMCSHVDDFLIASKTAHVIMEEMKKTHAISEAGPPEHHLGADVHQANEEKLREIWFMGSKTHVKEALEKV